MTRSVGVVLPAFRPDVERLRAYVVALTEALDPDEIRIELDDPDPGVAESLADLPATVNAVARRRGKGAAITAGFEALDTDVLVFADADGATPARSVADVVAAVGRGADLAAGSRRHPGATVASHQTVVRRHLGDAFAWLARRLLDVGLHDYQCGAKAMTRETWLAVRGHLHEPGFAWDVELLAAAAALDRTIVEVPVDWEDQPGSTVSTLGTAARLARALVLARLRTRARGGGRLATVLAGGAPPLVEQVARENADANADGSAGTDTETDADSDTETDPTGAVSDGGRR